MMEISKIHYITQSSSHEDILEEVNQALDAGADWIQLRLKNTELDFEVVAREVKSLCKGKAVLIINDHVDLAKKIDADGIHLGKKDMNPLEAREILGDKIIGGTANTLTDCKNLELIGVDYIGLGPYKFTKTKEELSPVLGLKTYADLFPKKDDYGWSIAEINTPVVAIGGIEIEDVKLLKQETSVHGIAVSGLIYNAQNKKDLMNELKSILWKN